MGAEKLGWSQRVISDNLTELSKNGKSAENAKPDPLLRLYGEINTDGLRESIEQHDIRVPLVIKNDNTIISGCRRCKAAVEMGKVEVPVDVKSYASDRKEN